jgi:hypothetical protein
MQQLKFPNLLRLRLRQGSFYLLSLITAVFNYPILKALSDD